jgi:hypothetical protein
MSASVERKDYLRLVEVFATHRDFRTEDARWKLVDEAFRGIPRSDAALGGLDLRDPPRTAAGSLVGRLLDFGRLGHRHSLSLVLEALRERVGDDRRVELDRLIGVLEGHQVHTAAQPPADSSPQDTTQSPAHPAIESRPMPETSTILFLAANPDGTTRLALDREAREIRSKIRAAEHRDSLVFRTEWAVRPDDLLQYLNEFRPQAVHFSGHGTTGELILNDANGRAKPVARAALRALFGLHAKTVRLAVLNACFSEEQADAIVEVIDCAVGMSQAIGDEAAIVFAAAFYRKLGFGDSVQAAFDEGRVALMLQGIPEEQTPVLRVRHGVDASRVFLVGPNANPS